MRVEALFPGKQGQVAEGVAEGFEFQESWPAFLHRSMVVAGVKAEGDGLFAIKASF